jgi:hypothetical protein
VQYPQLSRAQKKTRPFTLTIYGPEVCTASRSRHLDTGIETDVCYRAVHVDNEDEFGSGFVRDCDLPADEVNALHDLVKLISGE